MKKMGFRLAAAIFSTVLGASAATITVVASDSELGLFDSVSYTLDTIGNNSIGGQSGFTPASGQATLSTSTGVNYTNYLSSVPVGATITAATLDFAGLFSGQTFSSTLSSGTLFYQPAFASSLGLYTVTITSTLANTTVSGSSAVGYNLWTLFQADIIAGHNISLKWSAPDTFTANTSTYANNCKNCTEQFSVRDTANFTASNTANALRITYDAANVPEPATLGLSGLMLIGLASLGRKRR